MPQTRERHYHDAADEGEGNTMMPQTREISSKVGMTLKVSEFCTKLILLRQRQRQRQPVGVDGEQRTGEKTDGRGRAGIEVGMCKGLAERGMKPSRAAPGPSRDGAGQRTGVLIDMPTQVEPKQ